MPLKKRQGAQTSPGQVTKSGNTSQEICASAAAKWKVSPQTVWGIYGTESGYGSNVGPSSAGAEGPMQFIPSTAREYGMTTGPNGTVQNLSIAMNATAKYLHDLGATISPTAPKTVAAVNGYNGNGGGTDTSTSYYQSVLKEGKTFGGSSRTDPSESAGSGSGKSESSGGGESEGESLLSIGKDLLTGNMADLGQKLALAGLSVVKGLGLGFADLVVAPAWHWNQRSTAYYAAYVIDPRMIAEGGEYQWAFAWTAAFWGLGYVLFWTEGSSGPYGGSGLKAVPVHRTRVARHVRRLQAAPARKRLVKPSKVKAATPKKPEPAISKAKVTLQNTLSTTRPRQVKVYGTSTTRGREREREAQSTVPIEAVKTPLQERIARSHPKSHKDNHPRPRASRDKRVSTPHRAAKGRKDGRRS